MVHLNRTHPIAARITNNRSGRTTMNKSTSPRLDRLESLDQLQDLLLKLIDARKSRGITLTELACRTGLDRDVLANLESGDWAEPTVEILVRYAEAMGKKLVVLLYDA